VPTTNKIKHESDNLLFSHGTLNCFSNKRNDNPMQPVTLDEMRKYLQKNNINVSGTINETKQS
jgi:hypothetical protein